MTTPVVTPAPVAAPAVAPVVPAVAPVVVPPDGAVTLDTASHQLFGTKPDQSTEQTPAPQSTDGQAPVAPVSVEGDGTGKPVVPVTPAPDGQAGEVSDEDMLAAMAPTETPEAQLARVKREAGASRKESLRLKKVSDGATTALAEQGIDLVLDEDGVVVGLSPNEKYNKGSAANLALKFTELTADQQEQFESDPQALIDHVLKTATSQLTRAVPTVEKRVSTISPEQEQEVTKYVAGLVLDDGETKKHPNLDKNMQFIRQQLDSPSNKALREFYNQQPDLAMALLDASVDKTRNILTAKATAIAAAKDLKKQDADTSLSPAPVGGGEAIVVAADATPEQQGAAWGKAFGAAE